MNKENNSIKKGEYGWASGWKTEFRCESCKEPLSDNQRMYASGRCVHCGHKGRNAGTIVNTIEVPYRLRLAAPEWKFWIKPERIYRF